MQNKVKIFNKNRTCHKEPMSVSARILDIESEIGELSKEYLKSTNYGSKEFTMTADFKEEFGDVLYAILSLADETGINGEECLDIALNKLKLRMKQKNTMGSGR